jgi:hypothetical protein
MTYSTTEIYSTFFYKKIAISNFLIASTESLLCDKTGKNVLDLNLQKGHFIVGLFLFPTSEASFE